ncbi:hypothetical protein TNCV_912471 [Trichonephila clavipes]|nr:hypothetical protein TNCV_912471 [Trichonephila clavipes]
MGGINMPEDQKLSDFMKGGLKISTRSNSPYPRRNQQRRQSRSPSRRSPVRTRADYSVVSEQLRTQLRTPMFSEHNPILRTACGKVVEATGRCIVVTLIDGGQTAHSTLKLKLDIHKKPCGMCTIEEKADWLRYCKGVQS